MDFDDYETLPSGSTVTHMTAGAIAGIMEHCIMYPLDSVKTRMQSLSASGTLGISETFKRMIRNEGILRPVRGMWAMVIGAGPSHAIYFSSYEFLKNYLVQQTSSRYHTVVYGISGCFSTLIHDGIMNPAEVVKQRMQMLNSPYKTALQCFMHVYRTEGIAAFYRSYTTQLTMNVPYQSIHFMVYEVATKMTNPEKIYNPKAHMVSGALAGAVAAAVTTPLDVCKTLLNTQQSGGPTTGLVEAIRKVYRYGGPMGFFRGMQARIMYQMPATAICWSTYELFKYLLGNKPDVRLVAPVLAESEIETLPPAPSTPPPTTEILNVKPRELPAMSGTGIYGSLAFTTMHNTDACFNKRRKDARLDIVHT